MAELSHGLFAFSLLRGHNRQIEDMTDLSIGRKEAGSSWCNRARKGKGWFSSKKKKEKKEKEGKYRSKKK
jgi:hypothetical protein